MKKFEEKSYYNWLEDVIRDKKKYHNNFADNLTLEQKDAEIMLLLYHIEKKYPQVYEKLLAKNINANSDVSKKDILDFLSKSEKGASVTWKDKDGNEFVFVNAGEGSKLNRKRIVILGDDKSLKDLQSLRKTLLNSVLKKDIEHIYHKIVDKEVKRKQSSMYITEMFSKRNSITQTAGGFEADFKKMIRKQGFGANAMNTCQIMIRSMSGSEQRKLKNTFTSLGIKTGEDLERLLCKWKQDALTERPKQVKTISRSVSHEIGMGM